jgi:muramoyltetrapeptide carboxypeptidase
VDWLALAARPRPLIGISDNTALHLGAQRLGMMSLHGPHPAGAALSEFSAAGVLQALTQPTPAGVLPLPAGAPRPETVVTGQAEGRLVGGNLSLLAATLGTPWAVRSQGALLLLEEVGEAAYRIDRLLSQLRLAGVFNGVAGIVVGAINEIPDAGEPHVPSLAELLHDRLGDLGIPVASGFPCGHIDDNWTLPLGARARLDAGAGTLELLEAGVS